MWSDILYGFQVATLPMNLLLCFLGVLLGTLVGVLPGHWAQPAPWRFSSPSA